MDKKELGNDRIFNQKTTSVGQPWFEGCTSFPPRKGSKTENTATGEVHGICARCGNYSQKISVMGYCPICEEWSERNAKPAGQNRYIKAGERAHLDL